jgi:hypothetical protein
MSFLSLLLSLKCNEGGGCEPIYIIKRMKYIDDYDIFCNDIQENIYKR